MEKKYTPGPWIYDNAGVIHTPDKTIIADAYWDKKMSVSTGSANLKLMAAAPELLEALLELKIWAGRVLDWEGADPPTEMVDAAIKKATE